MKQAADPAARRLRVQLRWIIGICLSWLAWEICVYVWHLTRLPPGINAPFVLSASDQAFGIGPGGNESGLLTFALAPGEAPKIGRGGVAGLEARTGVWWGETPVRVSSPPMAQEDWLYEDGTGDPHPAGHRPSITDYLDRYGFGIGIGDRREKKIDDILNSPGAFYTYGDHGGMTIVSPRHGWVIYAYAG